MRKIRNVAIVLLVFILSVASTTAQDDIDYKTPQELADEDGQFISLEDRDIYIITAGDESDPAVILIHGFGGSTFTWRYIMDDLVDAGFYAVALDLPPFGLSDKSPDLDYSRAAMADTVADLMTALDIETATLVGHSMGGSVTAQFAVRHTERVDRLIFVAGGIFDPNAVVIEQSEDSGPASLLSAFDPESPLAVTLVRALLDRSVFEDLLISAAGRDEVITEDVVDGYARPLQIEDWAVGFIAYNRAASAETITLDDVESAVDDIPVLILWGAEDSWVDIAIGEAMDAALDNTTFVVYPEIGHLPMEEVPDAFNQDILDFLTVPMDDE